jgi:hypothetical protein
MLVVSNWPSALSDREISVTVKREKWTLTPGNWATIALVIGSSAVFDDGVSMPIRTRLFMMESVISCGR